MLKPKDSAHSSKMKKGATKSSPLRPTTAVGSPNPPSSTVTVTGRMSERDTAIVPAVGDALSQAKVANLQNYVVTKIEMLKKTQVTVKRMTQLASFIPDFILRDDTSGKKIPYQSSTEAVVFMVDVSGFTALTEVYSLKGKGGTDQLTKTISAYLSPLAESILRCDGDIVKYAGDAFLAYWRTTLMEYPETTQRAIDCALYIQEKYGSYLCKDVDITIKVKIGIGAGLVHLCSIGNDSYQHYVAFGPGVEAASEAENHCVSGEVVLHSSAWATCNPNHYKVTTKDETYRVVVQIYSFINPEKRGRPVRNTGKGKDPALVDLIRPIISESIETKSEEFLRRFILPPVLKKLDDDIPLEYLNESRQICICFIHLHTKPMSHEGIAFRENMIQIVNKAFVRIYLGVTRMQGALTKVVMFDKGLTYLVIFGLPGYINENQCVHALKFSHSCRRTLLGLQGVDDVSIGVTTGACFTGVVGHPRRQEYTVMGRKVNKAARLMVYYPGKVSCDQDTAYHSKLPQSNFELQEYKVLKGIANPGKIFDFLNTETTEDHSVTTFYYPMVNRDPEFRFFKDVLSKRLKELGDHNRVSALVKGTLLSKESSVQAKAVWMIVFEGENGIGKSRLLAACMTEAENVPIHVFSVGMTLLMSGQAMFGLKSLVLDALGIGGFRTAQEREEFLRKKVQEPELAAELSIINDVLHTKFPLNPKYANMDSLAVQAYAQQVLIALLKLFYPEDLIMFAVDDAQFMDQPSWEYLIALSRAPHIVCVLTLRRNPAGSPKIPEAVKNQIYHNKNIKIVRLGGLDPSHCKTLACQIMEVVGIPADLEKILMVKSQGVPAWMDQVLHELVRNGVLNYSNVVSKRHPMVYVDKPMLEKVSVSKKKTENKAWAVEDEYFSELEKASQAKMPRDGKAAVTVAPPDSGVQVPPSSIEVDPFQRVLTVKSGTNIWHVQVPGTLYEILTDSYDELTPNEQIILKCASVLGRRFSRFMVTRILPSYEQNAKKYAHCFNRLMEARYLQCASGAHSKTKDASTIPECFCKDVTGSNAKEDETCEVANVLSAVSIVDSKKKSSSKYWTCRFMEFTKDSLAEVVYDFLTLDQRKNFHLKAAKFLDSGRARCESCGGKSTTYYYGLVLKSNEFLDNEVAIRAAVNARKKRDMGMNIQELRQRTGVVGRRRASLQTQIAGMKRRFQDQGSKIAQIEFEIVTLLRRIDIQDKRGRQCCATFTDEDAEKELSEELQLLRDSEDQAIVNLKSPSGDDSSGSGPATSIARGGGGDDPGKITKNKDRSSSGSSQDGGTSVDLRLCDCASLQAKVCIEMVKHYREAEKYGKCMVNLLDAAENTITIGNGTQGLVHLEDAAGLMKAIRNRSVPRPDKDDPDDKGLNETEVESQIEYLNGLAYFEMGNIQKSKEFFLNSLSALGLKLFHDHRDTKNIPTSSIIKAKTSLFATRYCFYCISHGLRSPSEESIWNKKLRILSYLHAIFRQDKKLDLALLVSTWEVIISERYGDIMHDLIPAYSNMMSTQTSMTNHTAAKSYEKLSLDIIRDSFATSNEQLDPAGLLTTAALFNTIAYSRLCRGEVHQAAEAAYLGLRIAQTVHDNNLMVRLLPSLAMTLLIQLRIPELVDALQKLWYIGEEDDDWQTMANYYALCLDLLLRTAYPLESFVACENFVLNNDWSSEGAMYRADEVQFTIEASLALWYARYSRWEQANKWLSISETHRSKLSTFLSVSAELKMLECQLIFVNHYLDIKRYQHFAKARNAAKELMRSLTKSTKVAPLYQARQYHLIAYYYKIRSRNVEAEKYLRLAEKIAEKMNNQLELQWILHNRTVWSDKAIPTIKFFWLEHTENRVLDWHSSGKIPWANIMYSLPLPTWK